MEFCSKRAVRHCPARPAVVATYLADCAYRGEEFALKTVEAIEALHEHHGLSSPIATRLVTVALDKIVTVEPPRWPKEDKILFARLPAGIKHRIAERETQRDNALRQSQNKLAEERHKLNENKTEGTPSNGVEHTKEPVKLNEGPKLEDTQKGKEITEVYTNNDLGAVRGTRDGFA